MPTRKLDTKDEPLLDTTAVLPLRSKRIERLEKKRHQKAYSSKQTATIWDLPFEILVEILSLLLPSDILTLTLVNHDFHTFITDSASTIATSIIALRYTVLTRCFPLPTLLSDVDSSAHPALLDEERQTKHLQIHKKPYQHVRSPDASKICTCLTCILAWNNLCVILDFAFWQPYLEKGEPIPMIPRGKNPKWNVNLISRHASKVEKAVENPIFYARILQEHLNSTVIAIKRHTLNTGNKRKRFKMENADEISGTDAFLKAKGPPSMDFPFHRDNYYMLEAYFPNRGWSEERGAWWYLPKEQHERDVELVVAWKRRRDAFERVKRETAKEEDERNRIAVLAAAAEEMGEREAISGN